MATNVFTDSRYQLTSLLGNGGMARVYLAEDAVLARDVALKVLRDQYAENEEFIERFRREATSAASLSHPHIVQVYDRGRSADGSYYMTMEYLPGGTLKSRILREGALPPHEAARLALQIAGALGLAHERGVIHRDVKPQNILLTNAGNAKVGDFGIARASTATALSGTSMILGTAGYMSPEQAMGERVGPASDLYSLGVVLYEMLTGALPYDAETPIGIAMKHINETPKPPKETNPNVPEGLNIVTAKLLSKHPEDRYANTDELIRDLQRVRAGLPPLATLPMDVQETRVLSRPPRHAAAIPRPNVRRRTKRKAARFAAATLASVGLLGGVALAMSEDLPILEQAKKITGLGEENGAIDNLAVTPVAEEPAIEEPTVEDSEEEAQAQEEPPEVEIAASLPSTATQAVSYTPAPVAATEPVDTLSDSAQISTDVSPEPTPPEKEAKPVPTKAADPKAADPKAATPKTASGDSNTAREEEDDEDDVDTKDKDPGLVDFGPDGPVDNKKSKRAKKD
ncbi:MAG TPA: protein kinase [Rubrobacteraceae bacterium]|nr:protein kinase [Rubrobacteraceae bacterium]